MSNFVRILILALVLGGITFTFKGNVSTPSIFASRWLASESNGRNFDADKHVNLKDEWDSIEPEDQFPDTFANQTAKSNQKRSKKFASGVFIKQWSGEFLSWLERGVNDLGYMFTSFVFDSITSVDLFSFDLGKRGTRVGLNTRRDVYENYDLLNTWTVIDRFQVQTKTPIVYFDTSLPFAALPSSLDLNFTIGGVAGMSWVNVRRVEAYHYKDLASESQLRDEVTKSTWFAELQKPSLVPTPTPVDDPVSSVDAKSTATIFDFSMRPRLNKILNRVSFPFRLPLSKKAYNKMAPGELFGYTGFGGVELGASVGWKVLNVPIFSDFTTGASFRTYVRGEFMIYVLKESNHFVKVKISRIRSYGSQVGVNERSGRGGLIDGLILFEGSSLSLDVSEKLKTRLVPFSFKVEKNTSKIFDVAYRFNLSTDEGVDAFESSLLGSFYKAEQLEGVKDPSGLPITERIFEREALDKNIKRAQTIDLLFLHKRKRDSTEETFAARIELPDGTHNVLKFVDETNKRWSNIFGRRESHLHRYTVALDKESYQKNKPESLVLVAEGSIEDRQTNGREMNDYLSELKESIGDHESIPIFPERIPSGSLSPEKWQDTTGDGVVDQPAYNGQSTLAHYGRVNIYYGLNIARAQLEKIIALPNEKKKEIIEKVLQNAKLKYSIEKYEIVKIDMNSFLQYWMEIDPAAEIENISKKLGHLFSFQRRGREMMNVIQYALAGESLDYFYTMEGPSVGRIHERGEVIIPVNKIINMVDAQFGFEKQAGGRVEDQKAIVKDLQVKTLNSDQIAVSFELTLPAKNLYFRLTKATFLKKFRIAAELVVSNKSGKFVVGKNSIILSGTAATSLERELARVLVRGNFYLLNLGYSSTGAVWGPASTARFQVPK